MACLLVRSAIALYLVFYGSPAFAGEPPKPPRCVGRVCLEQRVERYRNIIKASVENASGPVALLKDDEGYVSAPSGEMWVTNWLRVGACASPGVVTSIHRTTAEEKGADYAMLLDAFEKRYGPGESLAAGGSIYEFMHRWRWENPATEFSLMKIRGSRYISIELRDLTLERKDATCAGRDAPSATAVYADSSAGPRGAPGAGSPSAQAPESELGHNMDQGLTMREVFYILSMQDALQAVREMIQIQEKLMGAVSPAEKESIRLELKRVQEKTRKIALDFRGVLAGRMRSE
jgi:hypothetical protein